MVSGNPGSREPIDSTQPVGAERITTGGTRGYVGPTLTSENVMPVRDRVQWGPIAAGTISGLVLMLLLSVLGLAVGASAFEPGTDVTDWGTAAGIWGAISVLASFFIGGWVAARTAAVGGNFAGLMNGLMAGAAILLLITWLATTGVGNVVGLLGANLGDIAEFTTDLGGDPADAEQAADEAADAADEAAAAAADAYDEVESGAWGTLLALILALGAAAVGGMVGHNKRQDLIEGTGATS